MNAEPLHDQADLDASIRRQCAARARELGGMPHADDIEISWPALETPPGARLFRAQWADAGGERALTGVCMDGEVSSRPLEAIALVLHRWRERTRHPPKAGSVASVCAFLLDADCRHRLWLAPTDESIRAVPVRLRRLLHEPVYLDGEAELPLAFCWLDANDRPLRVTVRCGGEGRIAFEAIALQDQDRAGLQVGEPRDQDA